MKRGLVQIYTGEGKGKTTAVLGLAMRAVGQGLSVFIAQFAKGRPSGELVSAGRLAPLLTLRQYGRRAFISGEPTARDAALARRGWEEAAAAATGGRYDLVALDELGTVLHFRLVGLAEVRELVRGRSAGTELVLSGRGIPEELFELADLVTEMRQVKHYYDSGVKARKGIEF